MIVAEEPVQSGVEIRTDQKELAPLSSSPGQPRCRFSGHPLKHTFVDLGMSPIANNNLRAEDLVKPERSYPLHVWVTEDLFLVQLEEFEGARAEDIFSPDYVYFSSYSDSWLA